ncbi:hypothetical protein LCGC14_0629920 [marine sediment metagenome]|uniref:Uncharacterized protein n=1 Tax=marine sediment metagenome TaxID=412755 RepID=A0A0F9R277_9ZZZZ
MPAIYQADTWCDSCADAIREQLNPNNLPIASENEYDSDEYPKWINKDEEADCPQHCGSHEKCLEAITLPDSTKIGALLSTSLTTQGVEYVTEAIADGGVMAEWWEKEFTEAGYDLT